MQRGAKHPWGMENIAVVSPTARLSGRGIEREREADVERDRDRHNERRIDGKRKIER